MLAAGYHWIGILVATLVCLFGTWIGMRHFARARATQGPTRFGWLFMASVGTGAALWASTFISILSLEPAMDSAFEVLPVAASLAIAIVACLLGFEIGSRPRPALAPELGGLTMGVGILAMHALGLNAWQLPATVTWNGYGLALTLVLGLGLGALAVNRANRPVTRYCRHGAAVVMTFMIFVMHFTIMMSLTAVPDHAIVISADQMPADFLAASVTCAVLLVMGSGFSSYVIDLRTRTESAERIHQLSFNDSMTGLPNRIAFNERLGFDLAEAHEKAHKLAAFSIDLDGFKDINDVYGHSIGDLVLIEAAARMRAAAGEGEFVARQSGDEFLALQMSGNQPDDARAFAERLMRALSAPFTINGHEMTLTASIGFSVFPTDTRERDQLVSNAKLAMHRGKSKHAGLVSHYEKDMDDAARNRRALCRDLMSAVKNGELELHFQLQTALRDGTVSGVEALMRWRHPSRGMISPGEFIPLAEETEAIVGMGEWALRTACRDAAAGKLPGMIAVNVSPVQFNHGDLADTIGAILAETGLAPERLEIEVTESMLMSDKDRGLQILRRLKAMGVAIAMDDFGTGYSSLGTLHAFPFDKIKLDQSFVRRIPEDTLAAAIVRTVLALGHSMNVPVLAEGIETEEQLRFLIDEGCSEGQGYLFAKPVPLAQIPDAMARVLQRVGKPVAGPAKITAAA
ncbi:MAG: putative bifunctional diguanylate cyclase/phosphodiesterase [Pseudomonadota bacterium]